MTITNKEALEMMINEPDAFSREDESDDRLFYDKPRLVEHLDEHARSKVSELIDRLNIEENPRILDLMAAVSSHIPESLEPSEVIGLGLNEDELKANKQLDNYVIHDLNSNTTLPFEDNSFDIVLNTVSVQYITDPFAVFNEVGRILKPGGLFAVIFSNRSFPTKAIKVWELLADDEKVELVRTYFNRTDSFKKTDTYIYMGDPRPKDDKYIDEGIPSDPIFAVFAEKSGGPVGRPERGIPRESVGMLSEEEIESRKAKTAQTMECPYCGEKLAKWKITDNPWTTWDHDLYVCINDACPYLIRGWREMYEQGNYGTSYRLVYDKEKDSFLTIPVPNLNVIKESMK